VKITIAAPAADLTAPRFLDTRAAARVLGIPVSTLQTWRVRGGGPPFRRIGDAGRLVRYEIAGLIAFAEARPAQRSTSDAA
jgi:hypothetical protein